MQTIGNWDDIRFFLAVASAGSVARAAAALAVNHTTVSRRLAALERRLHVRLFERRPNGWVITPAGEEILASAQRMREDAAAIHRSIFARDERLSGLLRVTADGTVLRTLLMPGLVSFARRHPDIHVELVVSDAPVNLTQREADIAFRCTDAPPPNLIGKRVAQIAYAVYGTRELRERCRRDPAGVDTITWIGDGRTLPRWVEKSFARATVRYRVSSLEAMFDLARCGLGLAQLPCALGDPDPSLERVPAAFVEPGWGLWVLSHVDLRTTARVRIFREHMITALEAQKDLIEGRWEGREGGERRPHDGVKGRAPQARTTSAARAK